MLTIRAEQLAALNAVALRQFGLRTVAGLRGESPPLVEGLDDAEISRVLTAALAHAARLGISRARDLESFIRLCFLAGDDFCTLPPFDQILTEADDDARLDVLFDVAAAEDWERAATRDILARTRATEITPALQRTTLVPLGPEHAEEMFHHSRHPDVWRLGGLMPEETLSALRARIAGDAAMRRFAIVAEGGAFVGAVTLQQADGAAALTYWVRRDCWGHGIATRAVRTVLAQARRLAPLLTVHIAADNLPSLRVVQKAGFVETTPDAATAARHFVMHWIKAGEK
jgi:RimJ/RimL family protein N-acetyltransferase